ncbi:MAG: Cys-tRNA(Pro) deacylase [Clostridia bacterium]|nr:Cys-tRNA(Pro) deacylase [Clostridia bacterium]
MANFKTNAMRIIEKEKIPYNSYTYDAGDGAIDGVSVAHKMGQDEKKVYKTLVTKGTGRDYYVFVIPVAKELDLKACARSVGEKSVEMIKVSDINKVTGYIRGGCSPIGMKKEYKTVIDSSCLELETMIFSGGKIGFQVEMSPDALINLIKADTADITA